MKYVEINGQRISWREILRLGREQIKQARQAQLKLFELREDHRPPSQQTGAGRYTEPTLFPLD